MKIISEMKAKVGGKLEIEKDIFSTNSNIWYNLYTSDYYFNIKLYEDNFIFFVYNKHQLEFIKKLLNSKRIPFEEEKKEDYNHYDRIIEYHWQIKVHEQFISVKQ